jgi:hypothetical protein
VVEARNAAKHLVQNVSSAKLKISRQLDQTPFKIEAFLPFQPEGCLEISHWGWDSGHVKVRCSSVPRHFAWTEVEIFTKVSSRCSLKSTKLALSAYLEPPADSLEKKRVISFQ